MGIFDWWRSKRIDKKAAPEPTADAQEAERHTTFVHRRLSPKAQGEIKKLRELKANGATQYRWSCTQFACFEAKKFEADAAYDIDLGLAGVSPVPGRETLCECDCTVSGAIDEP